MNLESQLLKIIEEQQNQLKQQQQEQEKALQIIQQQSLTIEQLKNYVNELVQRSNLVAKRKRESSQVNQGFTETPAFAVSIYKLGEELKFTFADTFRETGGRIGDREPHQTAVSRDFTQFGADRDREADCTTSNADHRECAQ